MIRIARTLALVAAAVFASHWLSTGPQTQATAAESASAAGVAIVKNQSSPHARLRSVDLTSLRWTGGFWAQRYAQANEVSLRKLWDVAVDVNAGHVAVMRGPLLYCLESADFPDEIDLSNVYVSEDIEFDASVAGDLPFGIRTLDGEGLYRPEASWDNDLYRQVKRQPMTGLSLRMIPYFAWANRGPTAMSVWLPVVWRNK